MFQGIQIKGVEGEMGRVESDKKKRKQNIIWNEAEGIRERERWIEEGVGREMWLEKERSKTLFNIKTMTRYKTIRFEYIHRYFVLAFNLILHKNIACNWYCFDKIMEQNIECKKMCIVLLYHVVLWTCTVWINE